MSSETTVLVKLLREGMVTIPKTVRNSLNAKTGDVLRITIQEIIKK